MQSLHPRGWIGALEQGATSREEAREKHLTESIKRRRKARSSFGFFSLFFEPIREDRVRACGGLGRRARGAGEASSPSSLPRSKKNQLYAPIPCCCSWRSDDERRCRCRCVRSVGRRRRRRRSSSRCSSSSSIFQRHLDESDVSSARRHRELGG